MVTIMTLILIDFGRIMIEPRIFEPMKPNQIRNPNQPNSSWTQASLFRSNPIRSDPIGIE